MENDVAQDTESEKALLCLIMQSNGQVLDDVPLVDEHFLYPPHRILFPIFKEIVESGHTVDFTLVSSALTARSLVMEAGGLGYLQKIQITGAPYSNRHEYFSAVNECLCRRRLLEIGQIAQDGARPTGESVEESAGKIADKLSSLDPSSSGNDVLAPTCDAAITRIDAIAAGNTQRGPRTGIEAWDDAFGGMVPGWMFALCARQGLGKTAMMEQMVAEILAGGEPVCVFSCDMDPEQLVMRMACRGAGVSLRALERGKVDPMKVSEVKENIKLLKRTKFRLHNLTHLDSDTLIATCRNDMRRYKCKIFFLDHIQLIKPKKDEDRRTAISNASKAIRNLCTRYKATFVALAHLNRNAAEETARAHHVKESDDVLGEADGLVMLHATEDPSELEMGEPWEIDFIVGKNRLGPTGRKYPLDFHREIMEFHRRDLAK